MEMWQWLIDLSPEEQALVAGSVAWLLTQGVKFIWKPPEEAKLKKLFAVVFVAVFPVLAIQHVDPQGAGGFFLAWGLAILAAIGVHESTDKLGLQTLLHWPRAAAEDEAGGEG